MPPWVPLPGPQTQAYDSPADHLYYGGAAGGGKTDLLLGLAATRHRKSLILRRELPQLREITERSRNVYRNLGKLNDNLHFWRLNDGRLVELGGVQHEHDKENYQGRPHDLYGFDELPQFSESIFRFITGWNRTTDPKQRCRVVGAGNPPTSVEGEWVIRYWAPWLDPQHPNPAMPGELRWFAVVDSVDKEVGGDSAFEYKGELIEPKSRTFIPANLKDNPFLMQTGYRATLAAMPEPLRSQMLYGDFSVGTEDDPWQVIPTAWIRAAQARWTEAGKPDGSLTALGVDVARGGKDKTILAPRYGQWFGPLQRHDGSSTPDGPTVGALVMAAIAYGGYANIDGIGVGASVYDFCRQKSGRVRSIIFSESATTKDRTKTLDFANLRAQAYWSMREALDPATGDNIALPPDPELLADLCAPHWTMRLNGILIESKEDIATRIHRSTDAGDAVVLAAYIGPTANVRLIGTERTALPQGRESGWR